METRYFWTIAGSCLLGVGAMACHHLTQPGFASEADAGTGAMTITGDDTDGGPSEDPDSTGGATDQPGGQMAGDAADRDATDGDTAGGDSTKGDRTSGDPAEGDTASGDSTEGDTTSGGSTGGGMNEPGAGEPSAVPLGTCTSGDVKACDVFIAPTGVEIPLGPYGAAMEYNVGQGFENGVAIPDLGLNLTCTLVVDAVGENPEVSAELLETGSRCPGCPELDFSLYTIYRPANMVRGERYPLITWGNGTCVPPEGYGGLLRYVASHGFVIVAPNSRWVHDSLEMARGLDFMFAANRDSQSPYYQHIDTAKVGAMGHARGGLGASITAVDPRIEAVVLFNGGVGDAVFAQKPYLAISGDFDVGPQTILSLETAISQSPKAAFLFYHQVAGMGPYRGHLTLMIEPERVVEPTVDWWKYIFFNDAAARERFIGPGCGLCNRGPEFSYGQHGLEPTRL